MEQMLTFYLSERASAVTVKPTEPKLQFLGQFRTEPTLWFGFEHANLGRLFFVEHIQCMNLGEFKPL